MSCLSRFLGLVALLPSLAQAGSTTTASGAAGIFSAQPGAGVEVASDLIFHAPLALRGELAIVGRAPLLETVGDGFFPLVGLASVELSAPFSVGPRARLGPMLALDTLAISAVEQDCGLGVGCRISAYRELGGLGLAAAAALGLAWTHVDSAGLPVGLSLDVGLQPTWIYDVVLPIAPRLGLAWTTARGMRFAAEAARYGVGVEVGQRI